MDNLPWIWLGIMVVALILEAVTVQLVSIWFAFGALGALIACLLHAPLGWQIAIFVVLTLGTLIATRPLLMKSLKNHRQCTNADRVIGMTAVVKETINNEIATGLVRVANVDWTARTVDDSIAEAGTSVQVQSIEGVKLMVLPLTSAELSKINR